MPVPFRAAVPAALLALCAAATLSPCSHSQASPQTSPKAAPLWNGTAPLSKGSAEVDTPTLAAYLPAQNPTHTAIVIAPGGGYQHLSMQKEGEDIASWLNARGVAGFVLKYRLGPHLPSPRRARRRANAPSAPSGRVPQSWE